MKKGLLFVLCVAFLSAGCAGAAAPAIGGALTSAPAITAETVALTAALVASSSQENIQVEVLEGENQIWYADAAHAIERHGAATYDAVEDCISKKGALLSMFNPATKRKANVCQLDSGKFGVEILEADDSLVTTFLKEKLKSLEAVIRYLSNVGYVQ